MYVMSCTVLLTRLCPFGLADTIKLQLVEAGLVECLLEVVAQTVNGEREEDVAQLKTASDLMVLLLLGGKLQGLVICWFCWFTVCGFGQMSSSDPELSEHCTTALKPPHS